MFKDRDFGLVGRPPQRGVSPVVSALEQDLDLPAVLGAMASGDSYIFEVSRLAMLSCLTSPTAVRYRQAVLRDCARWPEGVREMYRTAEAVLEEGKSLWRGERPISMLASSLDVLELCLPALKRVRAVAEDDRARAFSSEAFTALFRTLREELSDQYLSELRAHLALLRFDHGTLLSAQLSEGNKPGNYALRLPPERHRRALWSWARSGGDAEAGFEIHPRNEAGMQALEDMQARGIAPLAATVRRAADDVRGFFEALRAELAFYLGALNLQLRLSAKGGATCLPEPAPEGEVRLSARGLYDPGLSLLQNEAIVGNDLRADGRAVVVITGANQGGKSTFLRALGLAQLMMQSGMFVAATSYEASLCRGVFTHFKAPEDDGVGRGRLDEELARLSELAPSLSGGCMVLFNEPLASTNEREGSEIGLHVVRALSERGVRVVLVTHLSHLARTLHDCSGDQALFLRAERLPSGQRTFRLLEGRPLATSYGDDLYLRIFGDKAGGNVPSTAEALDAPQHKSPEGRFTGATQDRQCRARS